MSIDQLGFMTALYLLGYNRTADALYRELADGENTTEAALARYVPDASWSEEFRSWKLEDLSRDYSRITQDVADKIAEQEGFHFQTSAIVIDRLVSLGFDRKTATTKLFKHGPKTFFYYEDFEPMRLSMLVERTEDRDPDIVYAPTLVHLYDSRDVEAWIDAVVKTVPG